MTKNISVAILGSTGYVGLELVKILSKHKKVRIAFLGTENSPNTPIVKFDSSILSNDLPLTKLNKDFDYKDVDTVFLALPHGISNKYAKLYYGKIQIIDLSADFRLDDINVYKKNYGENHSCPDLLSSFIYGLAEYNRNELVSHNNIAVPGCYPTSILLPLLPLLKNTLIKTSNIIIDSKSGYSGAGKKFDLENIKKNDTYNFYNYSTNNHRHISEIKQELKKGANSEVFFSFNPHILPNFRGMMSTIYCDLSNNVKVKHIIECFSQLDFNNHFIKFVSDDQRVDFFSVQNGNKCVLKILNHYDSSKIIIVSLIDNLQKGAAGQAVQCFNLSKGFEESSGLIK